MEWLLIALLQYGNHRTCFIKEPFETEQKCEDAMGHLEDLYGLIVVDAMCKKEVK